MIMKNIFRYLLYLAVQIPAYRSRLYEDSRNDLKFIKNDLQIRTYQNMS